jgi:hypothetical protein
MLTAYLLIICLAVFSRFHGGGFNTGNAVNIALLWNKRAPCSFLQLNVRHDRLTGLPLNVDWPRPLRTLVFSLPYFLFGWPAAVVAYVGKSIGHEDFWNMGFRTSEPDKNWLCKFILLTGLKRDSLAFCCLGMAIKGAITAAGTLNIKIIVGHAIALPLAYYIGERTRLGSEVAEYLSGAFYGVVLGVILSGA